MKKVLIVTYYWPPAGGPGVQRWLKFVKYLPGQGVEPIVYIPENPTYPLLDQTLVNEVSDQITIIKQPILEPYRFAQLFSKKESKTISKGIIANEKNQSLIQKLLLYIRGNFFIPDARKFWVSPSIQYLKSYIEAKAIKKIITTGPPHSVHLIGKGLKDLLEVQWIADFRDPWTTIGYHNRLRLTKRSEQRHKTLEKSVLQTADHIVVTSFRTQKEFQEITTTPVSVITNGYDIENVDEIALDDKFTIAHIGSLLSRRNPKVLWEALYELTQENIDFAELFQLHLVGAVSDDVLTSIRKAGLSDFLILKGYLSHKEAIKIQRSSQVLLLIEIDSEETKCIIPGKLFEYMIAKRPILAIGPNGADISRLINESNVGVFFEYNEKFKIKEQLLDFFQKYKQKQLFSDAGNITKYSRKELTKALADILKSL